MYGRLLAGLGQEDSPSKTGHDTPLVKGTKRITVLPSAAMAILYVNSFTNGDFFRIEVRDGAPGKITKLKPSRPLKFPDGLRSTSGQVKYR